MTASPPSETDTPPVCPTCHEPRDADVPCSNAFHIAPPTDTQPSRPREPLQELDRLMDALERIARTTFIDYEADAEARVAQVAARDALKAFVQERTLTPEPTLAPAERASALKELTELLSLADAILANTNAAVQSPIWREMRFKWGERYSALRLISEATHE